ncbi:glycosyltransferase [Flavobacterium cheongpyeongense]|nr:glycosyltransferase [Flavobacterium cheongpyeongense]
MSNLMDLSIIIPHKNSQNLLQRCLDSIPESDNIEIIIIDDNSSNVNKEIFPGVNRKDTKVIFSETDITAGGARNIGLDHVSNKWMIFADADDFFLKDAFVVFEKTLVNQEIDIYYFRVSSVFSDTLERATRDKGVNTLVDHFLTDEAKLRLKHIVPWGKVFSSEFVRRNSIRFDEVPASNDIMFGVKTGFLAKKITVIQQEVYCVTMNRGSISNTLTAQNNRSRYIVMLKYNEYLRKNQYNSFQNSIRPFIFNSLKFGFIDFFESLKLMFYYKDSFFYNFHPFRSAKTFLNIKMNREKNSKYIIK